MKECKGCGHPIESPAEKCPSCGDVPGAETITDFLPADTKDSRRELREEIREEWDREEKTGHPGRPGIGTGGGGLETITDLPPAHLREARKKLKEEIREAREEKKGKS